MLRADKFGLAVVVGAVSWSVEVSMAVIIGFGNVEGEALVRSIPFIDDAKRTLSIEEYC